MKKAKKSKKKNIKKICWALAGIALTAGVCIPVTVTLKLNDRQFEATVQYAPEPQPAMVEDDRGEIVEEESIPTVEEVDGGKVEDITTGLSVTEGEYADLGWAETYNEIGRAHV